MTFRKSSLIGQTSGIHPDTTQSFSSLFSIIRQYLFIDFQWFRGESRIYSPLFHQGGGVVDVADASWIFAMDQPCFHHRTLMHRSGTDINAQHSSWKYPASNCTSKRMYSIVTGGNNHKKACRGASTTTAAKATTFSVSSQHSSSSQQRYSRDPVVSPTLGQITAHTKAILKEWLEERIHKDLSHSCTVQQKNVKLSMPQDSPPSTTAQSPVPQSRKKLPRMPSPQQMIYLQERTSLTRDQIRRQLRRMRRDMSVVGEQNSHRYVGSKRVSPRARALVKLSLVAHNGHLPTRIRRHISSRTGLSLDQIASMISNMKPGSEITSEKREILTEWMSERHFEKRPTGDQMQHLVSLTSLSPSQISMQCRQLQHRYFSQRMDKDDMEKLEKWMRDNATKRRVFDRFERQELRQRFNVTPIQLNQVIRRYENKHEKRASKESREIVKQWLERNDYRSPDASERDKLQEKTCLTRDQLKRQLRYLILGHVAENTAADDTNLAKILDAYLRQKDMKMPSTWHEVRDLHERIRKEIGGDDATKSVLTGSQMGILSFLRVRRRREKEQRSPPL
uniref:Uncharacterized protein n=1 Tax=Percolomonas cosmopolitus TaxID=63605 RepID=A0A7S1KSM8_9EUKA|mmetsp:Transcript_6794/g.25345  ORF Transcript_6794/g.25345 Transcript_6794/m.25345 type:complete len:564 (+) Transcript_6794:2-1693(+)